MYPNIITIGSSDNIGRAGIQADLKAFSDFNCYATNVIVSVTAQSYSDKELFFSQTIDTENIAKQIDYVIHEFPITTIKTGMIPNKEIGLKIAEKISQYKPQLQNIVADPVLTNNSGKILFGDEIIYLIKNYLIKLATVITPNISEFQMLFDNKFNDPIEMQKLLPCDALIKCGNIENKDTMIDYCFSQQKIVKLETIKLEKTNIRGDGCMLAASLTALLSKGYSMIDASKIAKQYVWDSINQNKLLSEEISK